jgi:hypothetical protein
MPGPSIHERLVGFGAAMCLLVPASSSYPYDACFLLGNDPLHQTAAARKPDDDGDKTFGVSSSIAPLTSKQMACSPSARVMYLQTWPR